MPAPSVRSRRGPLVVAVVVGLGLALAPAAFQMFSRAPGGADMIDGFRPYMTEAAIGGYQGQLAVIDDAHAQIGRTVLPALKTDLGLTDGEIVARFPSFAAFVDEWPTVDADMGGMLRTMRDGIPNYEAVDALPSFVLFPWFFVAPGLLIAGLSLAALVAGRRGRSARGLLVALAVMGLGVVAAPAIFQMFTRAPKGAEMIDDFRPYMTVTKLRSIQGYFVTMAAGEGNLRTAVLPALTAAPGSDVARFVDDWPETFRDFAPMIATMQENVENYQGVDALPPFGLFPWFFVVPGAIVAAMAVAARRPRRSHAAEPPEPSPPDPSSPDPRPEDRMLQGGVT